MSLGEGGAALHRLTALDAVTLLKRGEVTPLELVEAAARRIEATDGLINALPTLCLERARDHAERIMAERGREHPEAWLGGLPVAVKDLVAVAGVRTTQGSPIYADHVPARSDIMVERLEAHGAIVIGKSNTPEFGAGASTFNEVFGKTRNPWNTAKSVAGSSGGAAAALAAGQVWLADGSDLGGSLRTPASFNAVIGLRPSPGRVARGPSELPFQTLSVRGPMARTAADAALMLDAMTGQHPEDPLSLAAPTRPFLEAARAPRKPRRVAYSPDLGLFPVAREVKEICTAAAGRFAEMGVEVEQACPDFSGAVETFQTLRAAGFAADLAPLLETRRDLLKPEVIWNIEKGLALTADDIGRAERARGALYHRVAAFFETYDLLLSPAAIVAPFDVDIRYIEEVEGRRFDNYIEWVGIAFAITLTGCPALSAPAGFTESGLPVGLQIVGPPRGEAAILSAAALLEEATGIARRLPVDPQPAS
ncbi:MAG: amidase family protein [Rhodospirillales bacterium]|nr:amidase family protein [Rhodospirillales bacterium]